MVKALADRCPHCGGRFEIPLHGVTVVYHPTDSDLDRYQWQHDGCPVVVKTLGGAARRQLSGVVGRGGIPAVMRDAEWDDPHRYSDAPAIDEDDCIAFMRALSQWPRS